MNALKHAEAIFVAVAAIAVGTIFFTTDEQPLTVAADRPLFIHPDLKVPVVTIVAKRLTEEQKQALM